MKFIFKGVHCFFSWGPHRPPPRTPSWAVCLKDPSRAGNGYSPHPCSFMASECSSSSRRKRGPLCCRHLRCLQPLAIALRYYRQCLFWDRWNSHCVLFDFCVFPYHYNLSIFHVLWMSFKTVCFYDCESNTDLEPWRSSGRSISVHNPST